MDEFSFVLKPSSIEGVGVFAMQAIAQGTQLRLFSGPDSRAIPFHKVAPHNLAIVERYSLRDENKQVFWCPADFGQMEIGWYLNHSDSPNAEHRNYVYYAKHDINSGEEITIDYRTLENPDESSD